MSGPNVLWLSYLCAVPPIGYTWSSKGASKGDTGDISVGLADPTRDAGCDVYGGRFVDGAPCGGL